MPMGWQGEWQVVPRPGHPWPEKQAAPESQAPVVIDQVSSGKFKGRHRSRIAAAAAAAAAAHQAADAATAAAVNVQPPPDDEAPPVERQVLGAKRLRVTVGTGTFSSRDPAVETWTSQAQVTAANRLRAASELDFDRRARQEIENAAIQHVSEPKPTYVPFDVTCAALDYEHGKAPSDESKLAQIRSVQFYEPHDSFFKGELSVAFREDFEFADVDALVDGISPMRRRFLIHAGHIYVVFKDFKTWILCSIPSGADKPGAISKRISFHDARPAAYQARGTPPQMFVVQTTAKAPTTLCGGRQVHDPSVAAQLGQLHNSGIFEYAVPADSPWLDGALKSTPHTVHPMAHVIGTDKRPVLSVAFKKEVPLIQLHKLLLDTKLEGRVTRWGTILLPLLTPAAEAIFKRAGGELPKDRLEKVMAAKRAARAKEKAERLAAATAAAADKAAAEKKAKADAEAARLAELEKFPTKIFVSATNYPFLAVKNVPILQDLVKKTFGADTKFLYNDVKCVNFGISTDGALASHGRTLRIGELEFRCEIDPAVYFLSKHVAAAAASGDVAQEDGSQAEADAAVLARAGTESGAAAPRSGDDE
jgi:hypothetical protein